MRKSAVEEVVSIIEEAHNDIVDRLGFGLPEETSQVILRWIRRVYSLGALDERSRHERTVRALQQLQEVNADQLREINTYRRLLRSHGLL